MGVAFSLPVVLSIAGSDCSGGAGIEADLKTILALGLFGEAAITSVTAQNTVGVRGCHQVPPDVIEAQVDAVFEDIAPAAVKVGMLGSAEAAHAVARALRRHGAGQGGAVPVVLDPAMASSTGASLSGVETVEAVVDELFGLATLVTPNIPEAVKLAARFTGGGGVGVPSSRADVERLAARVKTLVPGAVLVKGGHATGAADDLLVLADCSSVWLPGERIAAANTHGTGCTLSSAIACGLAEGLDLERAVRDAKAYLAGALRAGLDLGAGSGPVDHAWYVRSRLAYPD